jgi:hypothetical protein
LIRFTLIAALVSVVFFQIVGEKVPINDGAMGDGLFFREVAGNFLEKIEGGSYNVFQMQRVMPFAFVNVVFGVFEIVKSHDNLIRGMLVLHFLFLGLGIYWYFSLATKLRLGDSLSILGFVLLFVNFAVLKDPWYNPFSTDLPTLMLAIGQANYFIKINRQKLFLISIVAGFVWPTMLITGLLLLFLPSEQLFLYSEERPKSIFPVVVTSFLFGFLVMLGFLTGRFENAGFWSGVLYVGSIVSLVLFVLGMMVRNPIDWGQSYELLVNKTKARKMGRLVGIFLVFVLVIFLLSGNNKSVQLGGMVLGFIADTLRFPGDFLVGHLMFFGFLIPLSLAFFPRMVREAAKLGMGMTAVGIMIFVFALHPESRLLLAFFPFMVVLLLKAVRRYRIVNKDLIVISAINVLISLFWLPINVPGMEKALVMGKEAIGSFPAQRYWMHFGHMMSLEVYLVGGLVFTFLVFLAWKGKVRYKREEYRRNKPVSSVSGT